MTVVKLFIYADVKVTLNSNTIPIGSKATQSVFIKKTIGELKEQFGELTPSFIISDGYFLQYPAQIVWKIYICSPKLQLLLQIRPTC